MRLPLLLLALLAAPRAEVLTWGHVALGASGRGATAWADPGRVLHDERVAAISAGFNLSLALTFAGDVFVWRDGDPELVAAWPGQVVAVEAGANRGLVVLADGTVWDLDGRAVDTAPPGVVAVVTEWPDRSWALTSLGEVHALDGADGGEPSWPAATTMRERGGSFWVERSLAGEVWTWGTANVGRPAHVGAPLPVAGTERAVDVAIEAGDVVYALLDDGSQLRWGPGVSTTPVAVPAGEEIEFAPRADVTANVTGAAISARIAPALPSAAALWPTSAALDGDVTNVTVAPSLFAGTTCEWTGVAVASVAQHPADGSCALPLDSATQPGALELRLAFAGGLGEPGAFELTGCPAGFQSRAGVCEPCAAGTYRSAGMEACEACSAGTDTAGLTGAASCQCAAGFVSVSDLDCECPAGRFLASAAACDACAADTFSASADAAACEACPAQSSAAAGSAACRCAAQHYFHEGACQECGEGMACDEEGLTFATVRREAGYWLDKARQPLRAMECLAGADACPGGGGGGGTTNCSAGFTGVLCGACAAGYAGAPDCVECEAGNLAGQLAALGAVCALAAAGAVLLKRMRHTLMRVKEAVLEYVIEEQLDVELLDDPSAPGNRAKLVVGFLQLLAALKVTHVHVPWPGAFADLLAQAELANVNPFRLPGGACLLQLSHYERLLVATLGPPVAGALLRSPLLVLFVTYPAVCTTVLQTFACVELPGGDAFVLADVTLRCDDETWAAYAAYAAAMAAVYALGVPLLFLLVLRRRRVAFLCDAYEERFYWWECVELLRKLAIVSVLVLVEGDGALLAAALVALLALVGYAYVKPFDDDMDDRLMLSLQVQTMTMLLYGMLSTLSASPTGESTAQVHGALLVALTVVPLLLFFAADAFERYTQLQDNLALARKWLGLPEGTPAREVVKGLMNAKAVRRRAREAVGGRLSV